MELKNTKLMTRVERRTGRANKFYYQLFVHYEIPNLYRVLGGPVCKNVKNMGQYSYGTIHKSHIKESNDIFRDGTDYPLLSEQGGEIKPLNFQGLQIQDLHLNQY